MSKKAIIALSKDTMRYIYDAQLLQVSSSLAYTTLLSIVPLLAVSFAIFQAFGGLEKLYGTVEPFILSHLAEGTNREVMSSLRTFVGNIHGGALGMVGSAILIVTSMSMLASAEKAINRIWKTRITRHFFHRIAVYWLFITLGPLALAFILGATTSTNLSFTSALPKGTGAFLITWLAFFLIYFFVPNRKVHWKAALFSSTFAAVMWSFAKWGYSLYTSTVISYNKIYGSLGVIPVFFLWIYICWVVLLTGVAVSAAIQKNLGLK